MIATQRKLLIEKGFRTIGCYFSGSSDEGYIEEYLVPTTSAGLYELREKHHDVVPFEDDVGRADDLVAVTDELEINLSDFLYDLVNTHFPGDWVNDHGGYGHAYVDLATGEYFIDGMQRVVAEEDAVSSGTHFTEPVAVTPPTTDAWIKSILS